MKEGWSLENNLDSIRKEFPILERCFYLISNSLGAVPRSVKQSLEEYYLLWAEEGVTAWQKEWWDLGRKLGNTVAPLIGAGQDEVTMMTNATQSHWIVLSTRFHRKDKKRNKIVMTEHDFPSTLYAVAGIAETMNWDIDIVPSHTKPGIAIDEILDHIDSTTLFVAVSHVFFKSAFVQDISKISFRAHEMGAWTLIDGYHGPGTIPVDVKKLGVDFYIGGCLKWLCGGPGNAFLYVRPDLATELQPSLTGWLSHKSPFSFSSEMEQTKGSYRFMSGTFPVPALYTAFAGLDIIKNIGISEIRKKSLYQTNMIIRKAMERNFPIFTPTEEERRGGAVSLILPHAFQVKQALENAGFKIDFRKGRGSECDLIRIGPHFYTRNEEIEKLFSAIDTIYSSVEFKKFPDKLTTVT